jgi:hypothetical protein
MKKVDVATQMGFSMSETSTARLRIMLQGYEQQMLAARRLARLRVNLRMHEGLKPEDPDPAIKRRLFVEKTARELYETLVFTGGSEPVVESVKAEFGKLFGRRVQFTYPPGERLKIVAEGENGLEPLSEDEQCVTRHLLRQVIRQLVERSMLDAAKPATRAERQCSKDSND